MRATFLVLALVSATALAAGDDTLDVEQARRLVVEALGGQALPSPAEGWTYRMEGDGGQARMVVDMKRPGPLFRFVRGDGGWRLSGMELPDDAAPVSGGERTAVLTIGPDDDVTARVREARRDGAEAVVLRFTGLLPETTSPPAAAPSTPEPAPPATVRTTPPAPERPPGDQAERLTREALERLAGALGRRQRSEGHVPAAPDGATIDEMEERGDFLKPFYLRRVPRADGWERPIVYTAGRGGTRYELRSGGPDRELGTGDDIVIVNGRFRSP